MADLNSQTVHSGNTVSIRINGIEVGRAKSLSAQREFGTEGVYEIGSIMPQEHDYLKYTGTLTMNRMRVRKDELAKLGLAPLGEEVLKLPIFSILVTDVTDGSILEAYQGCSVVSYQSEIRANEFSATTAQFTFLTMGNA